MASRKRLRPDDDDGSAELEVESASSSFRQSQPKRNRLTVAQEQGGSVVSDDDDEPEVRANGYRGSYDRASGAIPAENGVSEDDDMEEEEPEAEDEALDMKRAAQIVEKQMRQFQENVAAKEGIIEEVYCRNFMCHSKLRIKLGPLINFVVGHNGSGKSAVLTALTMCLGGKATATNRGGSLKSLIKEGCDSATLAVKIKNQGDGAYKPDLYGQSITVERNFTSAGTSGFKLKNAEDRIISTKKADLDDILDFFAFQLDNPINVLTQDMARQFLSNSSPADKYKFFIKGTQLEALDNDYKIMEDQYDSMQYKLQSREGDVEVLKHKAQEAEQRRKRIDRIKAISEKVEKTMHMHAWAQVEEQEQHVDSFQEAVDAQQAKVQEVTDAAETASGTYEGHNQAYEAAQRNVEQGRGDLAHLEENRDVEKSRFDEKKTELMDTHTQERQIKEHMTQSRKTIKKLEGDIAEETQRLAGAEGNEHTQRLQRLEQLREEVVQAQQSRDEHSSEYAALEKKRNDAQHEAEQARRALPPLRDAERTAQSQMDSLRRDRGQQLAGYRQGMSSLIKAINNETRWRSKPVGPMGLHIRIKKPEWTGVVEKIIGGGMEGFICTQKEDQNLLSQVMKRVGCQCPIFIGNPNRIDTSRNEPEEGVDTILRVLEIDNDAVRNNLIVQNLIDQTALIPMQQDAHDFMNPESGRKPMNVKATIAHDARGEGGIRNGFSRTGAGTTGPVTAFRGRCRMKTDIEAQTALQQQRIDHAKQELDAAEQSLRSLQNEANRADQELQRHGRRTIELRTALQRAEDAVEALQNEIDSLRPQDGRLQELQSQLQEAKDEHANHASSYQDVVVSKQGINDEQTENKARLDAAQAELDAGKQRLNKIEGKITRLEQARQDALRHKNAALNDIDLAKRQLSELEERVNEARERLEKEFIPSAELICRRVTIEQGLTTEALDQRLTRLYADQEKAQRQAGGTREEVHAAWEKATVEYEQAASQLKTLNDTRRILGKALATRKSRWKLFRKYIAARACITFTYLLSERNFRGEVLMDHDTHELDISVQPDFTRSDAQGREARTLSGGEKSFSTICLLLSIWEAMGSPIRCLDEFDVFMDSVNRATSMDMMIKAARRSVGRQFILISPQGLGSVDSHDDVRVYRMSDPERGQTSLPFGSTQA
ncbi:hypothetical protein MBLNU230_g1402t1 [Neophaeotheca triangularis]